jgi:hypothetical protein
MKPLRRRRSNFGPALHPRTEQRIIFDLLCDDPDFRLASDLTTQWALKKRLGPALRNWMGTNTDDEVSGTIVLYHALSLASQDPFQCLCGPGFQRDLSFGPWLGYIPGLTAALRSSSVLAQKLRARPQRTSALRVHHYR